LLYIEKIKDPLTSTN